MVETIMKTPMYLFFKSACRSMLSSLAVVSENVGQIGSFSSNL